jgi:hypothetical protein
MPQQQQGGAAPTTTSRILASNSSNNINTTSSSRRMANGNHPYMHPSHDASQKGGRAAKAQAFSSGMPEGAAAAAAGHPKPVQLPNGSSNMLSTSVLSSLYGSNAKQAGGVAVPHLNLTKAKALAGACVVCVRMCVCVMRVHT